MSIRSALPHLLPSAFSGERFVFDGIACTTAGSGAPLALVHSINAAASMDEVRPLYEHFKASRTVFAIDLPGYGHSHRPDIAYSPRLMTDALQGLAAQVAQRCGAQPLDALAVSLSCEYLARAAAEQPTRWGRLALVSPTGFSGTKSLRGAPGSTRGKPWLHRQLSRPIWAQWLFEKLTKPGVVRYFLERTWGGKAIDEAMFEQAVRSAREPGARFAPLHFLAGNLFSADIDDIYDALTQPVWMSHGVRGDFTDYRKQSLVEGRPNWRFTVFDTGALPYFERRAEFMLAFEAFLAAAPQRLDPAAPAAP